MKLDEARRGVVVLIDGGFNCMTAGEKVVDVDQSFAPFVKCKNGRHYLDGQQDDDGNLVGIELKSTVPPTLKKTRSRQV